MAKSTIQRWLEYGILAAILVGYGVVGALYATQTHIWQAPDEPAHFNYIRHVKSSGCCPVIEMGDWDNAYLETLKDARFAPSLTGQIETIQYEDHQPPLYYLLTGGLLLGTDLVFFDTMTDWQSLLIVRLFSVGLGLGVVICAYWLARVMFPQRRGVALTTAALVAFIPQHVAILASANNDSLAFLLVAVTLLVCAQYISTPRVPRTQQRPALIGWHISLGLLVGLAFLTKTTVYFLVVIVVLAVLLRPLVMIATSPTGQVVGKAASVFNAVSKVVKQAELPAIPASGQRAWRRFGRSLLRNTRHIYAPMYKRLAKSLAYALAVVLGIALPLGAIWWVRNGITYGFPDVLGLTAHDVVVVGQLRTSERITQVGGFVPYLQGAAQTTYNSFWGQLGWMALPLPNWAYSRIGFMLVGAAAGVIFDGVYGYRVQRRNPTIRQVVIGILLGASGLLAAAAFLYYNTQFYQVQGRYLFPALIPFALLVAVGLDAWARYLGTVLARWLPNVSGYTIYLTPLLIAGSFGAFNLWLVRFVVPFLSPG